MADNELVELRRDLRRSRLYLDDEAADLIDRIDDWIERSHQETDADTLQEYVETRLDRLIKPTQPMYHSSEQRRGEEAFPDECESCPHYGAACPVLTDDTERRWRQRQLEAASTEAEVREVFAEQARDVTCHRIPVFLEEWDQEFSELVQEGYNLHSRVQDELRDLPSDDGGVGEFDPDVDIDPDADFSLATDGGDST